MSTYLYSKASAAVLKLGEEIADSSIEKTLVGVTIHDRPGNNLIIEFSEDLSGEEEDDLDIVVEEHTPCTESIYRIWCASCLLWFDVTACSAPTTCPTCDGTAIDVTNEQVAISTYSIPVVMQYSEDSVHVTSGSSWARSCRFSPVLDLAKYLFCYSAELHTNSKSSRGEGRIQINDTTTISRQVAASIAGIEDIETMSGIYFFDNTGGSVGAFNIDFDFRAIHRSTSISNKRLVIVQVTE